MKRIIWLALTMVLVLSLAACGNNSSNGNNGNESGVAGQESASSAPKTIKVGLVNGIPKIATLDESGKWQGYNYETLVEIDKLLPQYEFKYEPITDFQAAFVGLDTKAFDILSIHASWTEERAAKYLLGDASYYENTGYTLKVKKGSGIVVKTDDDLGGLKIALSPLPVADPWTDHIRPATVVYEVCRLSQHALRRPSELPVPAVHQLFVHRCVVS
jgi:L-cystine transport system substrate-binding protein